MSQGNVEIVRAAFAAWQRGDLDAMFNAVDEDIEWIAPPEDPDQPLVVGAAEARAAFERWMATWEDYRYELDDIVDAGDNVVQAGRQVMVARGAEVSSEIFVVGTVRDGRVVRVAMFYNRQQALEAAGLSV